MVCEAPSSMQHSLQTKLFLNVPDHGKPQLQPPLQASVEASVAADTKTTRTAAVATWERMVQIQYTVL